MFETDIAALLESGNVATHTHLMKTINSLIALRDRVSEIERRENRVLNMISQLMELDKMNSAALDKLRAAVTDLSAGRERVWAHSCAHQQAIDLLHERIERLEKEVRNG
jgi:polyhydroxyalkanoate synthesis regulator phasin